MRIALLTLGCKVNQAEIIKLERQLRGKSHDIVGLNDNPDLCIINTCSVTAKSDYQSRQMIRRAGKSGAKVLVTGCYAELNSKNVSSMDSVNAVIKNSDKDRIIDMIDDYSEEITSCKGMRTRMIIKVQDGCNNRCTYCIIPAARGASRSVPPEKVIEEVNYAVGEGHKEVILTGIHLGQYGADLIPKTRLSELLHEVLDKTTINRIRVSSLEINEIDNDLLSILKNQRVCDHLHIPLQSGDESVLKKMNRGYDPSFYRRTIVNLKEYLGDIALGTDVIAGFPSETEESFENTYKLLEELPFTYIHVFPYSNRPGALSSKMPDIVGHIKRKARSSDLRALAKRKKEIYLRSNIGKTLEVLIENKVSENTWLGTSRNYLKVRATLMCESRGILANTVIAGMEDDILIGKQVKQSEPIDSLIINRLYKT